MTTRASIFLLTAVVIFSSYSAAAFQSRDHLTEQEIELVKDAQVIDKRIDVFIKAADRRLLVLNGLGVPTDPTAAKQLKKDSETWGELPTGSRAELIGDIAKIFDEAITNIDDVSARDEKNPLIPKSLRNLAAAASRILDQLKPAEAQATGSAELGSFDQLTENAEAILQAANKLPPPTAAEKKERNSKARKQ
ncbi:MAG: hypothetical protein ABJC10_01500 [Acidobacteriota bacterium]